VAEREAEHARRSLAGALAGQVHDAICTKPFLAPLAGGQKSGNGFQPGAREQRLKQPMVRMTMRWTDITTFVLFGACALGVFIIGLVSGLVFYRDPSGYRRAFWRGEILTLPFFRSHTSRWEYRVLLCGVGLLMSLLLWLLVATFMGWLR